MLDPFFTEALTRWAPDWRRVVSEAALRGLVTPAFSASLAYFDSYRTERLQHNLLQAQRDYFGAHTYERLDEPGSFHTEWIEEGGGNGEIGLEHDAASANKKPSASAGS